MPDIFNYVNNKDWTRAFEAFEMHTREGTLSSFLVKSRATDKPAFSTILHSLAARQCQGPPPPDYFNLVRGLTASCSPLFHVPNANGQAPIHVAGLTGNTLMVDQLLRSGTRPDALVF